MEIEQLSKGTFNNQLQQYTNICDERNISQIWQVTNLWQG